MLTVNAMSRLTLMLVPMQCEYYALEGLTALIDTITNLAAMVSPRLGIEGIFTLCTIRVVLSNDCPIS